MWIVELKNAWNSEEKIYKYRELQKNAITIKMHKNNNKKNASQTKIKM